MAAVDHDRFFQARLCKVGCRFGDAAGVVIRARASASENHVAILVTCGGNGRGLSLLVYAEKGLDSSSRLYGINRDLAGSVHPVLESDWHG